MSERCCTDVQLFTESICKYRSENAVFRAFFTFLLEIYSLDL